MKELIVEECQELSTPDLPKGRNVCEQYRDWWGRWKFTHIYVAEKKVGGKIYKGNVVHHRDGNKRNNSPENLHVMKRWKHGRLHYAKRRNKKS